MSFVSDEKESESVSPPAIEEDEFVVEKILSMKYDKQGKRIVLIKWKGYPDTENSWEPEENCVGALELINEFEEQQSRKKQSNLLSSKQQLFEDKCHSLVIPDDGVTPRGFDRGLLAERIVGATTDNNSELMFLMKWKDCDETDLVKACQANVKCPQVVIGFYEERLDWYDEEDDEATRQLPSEQAAVAQEKVDS